jgi:hypothetical protein
MVDVEAWKQKQALHAAGKELVLDLLLHKGLYSFIQVEDDAQREAERQVRDANVGTFDCFCTTCKRITPFICQSIVVDNRGGGLRHGNALAQPPSVFALRSVCQRDLTTYLYAFQKVGDRLIKIGQLPSMADISFGELKGIDKGLEPVDRKELGTALGLFAHDAAAGAFVYLRRVFERMINRAQQRHPDAPIDGFDQKRMDEKIDALRGALPERVVKNRRVFAVLSQGVHELTDEQCKALFPLVKAVIFEMLEQEEHQQRKAANERETEAALQAVLASGIPVAEAEDSASYAADRL